MQLRKNLTVSIVLAFASSTIVAVACGGSSDGSAGADGTGGTGGTSSGGASSTTSINNAATTGGGTGGTAASGTGGTGGISGSAGETAGSGTGGTSRDGGSSGAGGSDGVAGTGPTGVIGVLGEPCEMPGQLACAGNHQKLTVVCSGDGEWETNETCDASEFCDTTPGVDQGVCRAAHPGCEDRESDFILCDGNSLIACGPDALGLETLEECAWGCETASCLPKQEPCPSEGPVVDCAGDCDAGTACGEGCPLQISLVFSEPTITVRVPSYSNLCAASCDSSVRVLGITIGGDELMRATVPAPWRIVAGLLRSDDATCEDESAQGCAIFDLAEVHEFHIFSEDPSAQKGNVVFELVNEGATCL